MAYKPKIRCPVDNTKLPDMVESRKEYETYHCLSCNTYWHFYWIKLRQPGKSGYKWHMSFVRDDYGKFFRYEPVADPHGSTGEK